MAKSDGEKELDRAFRGLEHAVPERVAKAIRWLRSPKARWVRIPAALLLIAASFFWYLPVVGIEMLPAGLLLIAVDVPFLQKPLARVMIWLELRWYELRRWWLHRKLRRASA